MTDYWLQRLPSGRPPRNSLPDPLGAKLRPQRDSRYADYCNVQWHALLAGDPDTPSSLDLTRSEAMSEGLRPLRFIAIRRHWDVDSFIT